MSSSARRRSVRLLFLLTALSALAVPASAPAAVSTFERFEVLAVANYTIVETCADGSTATLRVRVTGGHEEEAEDGTTTVDSDFMNVQMNGFTCDGFVSERFIGPATFTWSPSLQRASLQGTNTNRNGRTVTVNMSWEATGPPEVNQNTTSFPGFTGHFTGRERDAVATGTVVLDGETIIDGSTTNAWIETLEDKNISRP